MPDNESKPPKRVAFSTLPPPESDDDMYSASTKVGQASEELLALVRASEEERLLQSQALSVDDEATIVGSKDVAAFTARPREVARASALPSAPPSRGSSKHVTISTRVSSPAARRETSATSATSSTEGLPPATSIVLLFAVVTLVLAALVR